MADELNTQQTEQSQATEQTAATVPNPVSVSNEIDRVLATLNKERELRAAEERKAKDLARKLEVFEGVDPEVAKRAAEILKKDEERLIEQSKLEARVKKETEDLYKPQIAELSRSLAETQAAFNQKELDTALSNVFYSPEMQGFPGEYDAIAHAVRSRAKFDPQTRQVTVYKKDGTQMLIREGANAGNPATVSDLIAEMKATEPWFARHFASRDARGAGVQGNGRSLGVANTEGMSNWEIVARNRAAAAGK